jgi:hypothetical protein
MRVVWKSLSRLQWKVLYIFRVCLLSFTSLSPLAQLAWTARAREEENEEEENEGKDMVSFNIDKSHLVGQMAVPRLSHALPPSVFRVIVLPAPTPAPAPAFRVTLGSFQRVPKSNNTPTHITCHASAHYHGPRPAELPSVPQWHDFFYSFPQCSSTRAQRDRIHDVDS